MKKHFGIKPFLIAAAVAVTGAVSAVTAGAVENSNISDLTLPSAGAVQNITKPSDDYAKYTIPDEDDTEKQNDDVNSDTAPDKSYYYGNDPKLETEAVGGEVKNEEINSRTRPFDSEFARAAFSFLNEYHEAHKNERKNDSGYETFMGFNFLTGEVFYDTASNDFKMLYTDSDGTRHYENGNGEEVTVLPVTIDNGIVIYFMDNAIPEDNLTLYSRERIYTPAVE